VAKIDNKYFYAVKLTEEDRGRDFRCPLCKKEFICAIPKKEIKKYFRHKKKGDCNYSESPEHREMKNAILLESFKYGWKADEEVKIEARIKYRKTDVNIITPNLGKYAMECQCSRIPFEEVEERNKFYVNEGQYPIWILGGKIFYEKLKTSALEEQEEATIEILERELLGLVGKLFYYGEGEFYEATVKFRTKTLGMYNVKKTTLKKIMFHYTSLRDLWIKEIPRDPYFELTPCQRLFFELKKISEKIKEEGEKVAWTTRLEDFSFKIHTSPKFDSQVVGEELNGILLYKTEEMIYKKGRNGYSRGLYLFETEDGFVTLVGGKVIDNRLKNAKVGTPVSVTYKGWEYSKRNVGHKYRDYEIDFGKYKLCRDCEYYSRHPYFQDCGYCTKNANLEDEFPEIVRFYDTCEDEVKGE
jgi:hypothetical protein